MTEMTPVFDPRDARAVIDGRTPGRTPVAFITGIVLTAACGMVALGFELAQSVAAGDGAVPFLVALPLALLPVPLLVGVVLWVDRLEPEPRGNLVFAFGWGAGIAALLALIINTAGLNYVTQPEWGLSRGEFVSATIGAPFVEETLKGAVLVGLLWRRRQEFDGPTDGIIYAAMVGLGFAMIENVGYYISALITPVQGGMTLLEYTFVLRGVLSPLLHPLFTAMTGLGVAYAAARRQSGPWPVIVGWLAAMLLHGMWNGLSAWDLPGLAIAYTVMACVGLAVVIVLVLDRRRLVRLITRYLSPYATTGLISDDDVAMLASLGARRRARNWARATAGLPAAAAMSDYQLAATELALLHSKAETGLVLAPEFFDRQHDLVSLMHAAQEAFLARSVDRQSVEGRRVDGQGDQPPPAPWAAPGRSGFAHGTPRSTALPPPAPFPPYAR
jgi:RsiW-degrading membrane proteinase PrsW (M82 family)